MNKTYVQNHELYEFLAKKIRNFTKEVSFCMSFQMSKRFYNFNENEKKKFVHFNFEVEEVLRDLLESILSDNGFKEKTKETIIEYDLDDAETVRNRLKYGKNICADDLKYSKVSKALTKIDPSKTSTYFKQKQIQNSIKTTIFNPSSSIEQFKVKKDKKKYCIKLHIEPGLFEAKKSLGTKSNNFAKLNFTQLESKIKEMRPQVYERINRKNKSVQTDILSNEESPDLVPDDQVGPTFKLGWVCKMNEKGEHFYFNLHTGNTTYDINEVIEENAVNSNDVIEQMPSRGPLPHFDQLKYFLLDYQGQQGRGDSKKSKHEDCVYREDGFEECKMKIKNGVLVKWTNRNEFYQRQDKIDLVDCVNTFKQTDLNVSLFKNLMVKI